MNNKQIRRAAGSIPSNITEG
ncbi:four helix bundle protein [Thermodesulfobacteriota bacterium]